MQHMALEAGVRRRADRAASPFGDKLESVREHLDFLTGTTLLQVGAGRLKQPFGKTTGLEAFRFKVEKFTIHAQEIATVFAYDSVLEFKASSHCCYSMHSWPSIG